MKQLPVLEQAPAAPPEPSARPDVRFRVEGMDCAACARTVEKAVAALDGVREARVSFGAGSLDLWGDPAAQAVEQAVSRAGYRATPREQRRPAQRPSFWRSDPRALSTLAELALLAVAVVTDVSGARRAIAEPLYLASMAAAGWPIARAALSGLRRRSLDMNVLMTLAAVGAVGIGSYAEGAWVLVLFALGTTLETFALDRTRRSVEALAELAPAEAVLLEGGRERPAPVEDIAIGARILVRPGERVPLDGVVESGESSVDESPITGESIPVERTAGDPLYAGTRNQLGALVVRTTRTAEDSTIARIVELVEQAQASRAPSERFVDRFARIYTPVVFASALLLAVVPPLLGADWSTWIYRALALLIVACPCSLVISIPVAVVSAIGAAARSGVLLKGGQALEDLARVDTVAFDKTGTLTSGTPRLVAITPLDDTLEDEALQLAASLERHSEHPLAAAVVQAALERGLTLDEPERVVALPGRGVDAMLAGRLVWAGGPRLAGERLPGGLPAAVAALEEQGQTVILLGEEDRAIAALGLRDEPRDGAGDAVVALRRLGLASIMLTGDNEAVARSVAGAVGIAEHHAGLLPEDKLTLVQGLQERSHVAMVGDGINDAPALAAAQVGVAMGAAGSAAALDTADVALLSDELGRLPSTIATARAALSVMRQNVAASLIVKGAFVALIPFGLITLWMAVAADMGMSLLVTLNALRLLRRRQTAPVVTNAAPVLSSTPSAWRKTPTHDGCGCCADGHEHADT